MFICQLIKSTHLKIYSKRQSITRGESSRGKLSRGNCPGVNCPGVNCPGVNCPDTIRLIRNTNCFARYYLTQKVEKL